MPTLKRAGAARVVTLSSGAHRLAALDFDGPNFERREYDKWRAYGQSKTASVLLTVALDNREKRMEYAHSRCTRAGSRRISSGFITMKELQAQSFRNVDGETPEELRARYKIVGQDAATTVWCATSSALQGMGGVYCEDVYIAQAVSHDHKEMNGVLPWAIDPESAERLWELSERMTGAKL